MTRPAQQRIALLILALAALTCGAAGYAGRDALLDYAWIGLLRYGTSPFRARAVAELGARRSRLAVPHLVRALRHDPAEPVRYAAAEALGSVGRDVGDEAIRALVEALDWRQGIQ